MAKTLELIFETEEGKTAKIVVDNPKEPIEVSEIVSVMDTILTYNAFMTNTGRFVGRKSAQLVERNVSTFEV